MSGLPHAKAVEPDGPAFASVTLDYEARHRRRVRLVADDGTAFLLDLMAARHLRDGDRLVLEDGRRVLVRAAVEPVLDIAAPGPAEMARLAWHLGNRHTPTQIMDGALRIRADAVLAAMLRGLGAGIVAREAAFDPESGAYAAGNAQSMHDHDDHGHPHAHQSDAHGDSGEAARGPGRAP